MTYKQIQDEAILLRFNELLRASVKQWIGVGYERIWNLRPDWSFKRSDGDFAASIVTAAGDFTPAMPVAFAEEIQLFDDQGQEMRYITPQEWDRRYRPDITLNTGRARPTEWTVVDRQLYLGPVPDAIYNLKLSYWRRLCHYDAGLVGLPTQGLMVEDTDVPLWEPEHHYLLVVEAMLIGATLQRGADIQELKLQRDELEAMMIADHVPGSGGRPLQYGR